MRRFDPDPRLHHFKQVSGSSAEPLCRLVVELKQSESRWKTLTSLCSRRSPPSSRPASLPARSSAPVWLPASRFNPCAASTNGKARSARNRSGCCLRSEEHTSELQSRQYLVCRLLLEK